MSMRRVFEVIRGTDHTVTCGCAEDVHNLRHCGVNRASAGGLLIYRTGPISGVLEGLLTSCFDPKYSSLSDFGGQFDAEDGSPESGIARETSEESNEVITEARALAMISQGSKLFVESCKYLSVAIEVTQEGEFCDIFDMRPEVFGDWENHDGFRRVVTWTPLTGRITMYHPRIRAHIQEIKNEL